MRLKNATVNLDGLRAPMLYACAVVDELYISIAKHEVTLTSAKDGKHSEGSLHYDGLACDFRNRDVSPADFVLILARIRERLPAPYQIIEEKTHLHIEHDTKG